MWQDLVDAINRLDNALNELAEREAAQDIGAALGSAIGYPLVKTSAEIDAMTLAEIHDWRNAIGMSPPEGCPPIPPPPQP